ncbi:DUF2190 family protein [Cereibacter azotoformans]|uniref:Putative RecA/RadA family phage recombinase n=1 Tax=Cereibacter azotoformans TaxID=43057 RepID=A0A2T5K730_9RHOB|nr:DUF2190 family protein [Cereibacter azotoformans]MBO4169543.1 DUF2190 family protein [Cereibacter azotoformans]PTR18220.1 putative RecA/RadA family phage recombinase [Cereibacter azotoformans]
MKTYIQSGDVLTITAPAAIASGAFVKIGRLTGFAQADAAEGQPVAIVTRAVSEVPVAAADPVTVGAAVYADADGALTTDETDATYVGYSTSAAVPAAGVATVKVRLD